MPQKTLLLTGGSRGIGRAIADEAVNRGYFVSLGVRDPSSLVGAFDHSAVEIVSYDALAGGEREWVDGVLARQGRIDGVIACAGIYDPEPVVTERDDRVLDLFTVNVHAPRRLASAAWEALKATGNGRIVVLGSLSGKRVKGASAGLYSLSKFAAVGLAHALRHEGWDHGIRATAICPGFVATDMAETVAAGQFPMDRMTQAPDLARLIIDTMEQPNTLSQAEVTVNCLADGLY